MFATWGRFVAARRWPVLAVSALALVVAIGLMVTVSPDLSSEGFVPDDAESSRVDEALAEAYGQDGDALVFLFDADQPVSDPETQAAVEGALAGPASDDRVVRVLTTWSTGNPAMVSTDGMATYAVVILSADADLEDDEVEEILAGVETAAEANGLELTSGGGRLVGIAIPEEVEEGLLRAEVVSVPLTILIQVLVFGSLVAAGLPLLIGVFAIVASLAVIFLLSGDMFQSVFAINVITMLAILGTWVNRLSIRRHRGVDAASAEGGFWHDVAQTVMRYPVAVMAALLLVLLVAGLPVLRLDLTPGGPDVLPEDQEPRQVSERLVSDFPGGDAETTPVLVTVPGGDVTSLESIDALRQLTAEVAAMPGVSSVDSFVSPDVAEGAGFDWDEYTGDAATLPPPVQAAMDETVRGEAVLIEVAATGTNAEQEGIVRDIRALSTEGFDVQVGGRPAAAVDTVDGIVDGIVPAAIFVAVGSYIILLLTFGSVFLPLKAMFMTLLSISASLGAVVWVFQDGHLEGLLGFQASGEIISTTPILMFCILFGLSMDYEVLMLSRIQEEYERTGDNRLAVATGLEQTGKVITGAALIMVVVFGGFMLADIVVIKSLGFGLALAVLIDATIVRGLLVPATMRLMGRWNWWAPAGVRRVVDRLGFGHRESSAVAGRTAARSADMA
jgi:RND superfamily putative drug exporter